MTTPMNSLNRDQYKEVDERYEKLFGVGGAYNNENLWEVDKNIKEFWHSELEKVRQEAEDNMRKRCVEAIKPLKRNILHPTLRNKGEICDACSEDFIHNKALNQATQNINNLDKDNE